MGFYAMGTAGPVAQMREGALTLLGRFADQRVRMNTLIWLAPG
jgi:hypothetical protein